MTILADVNTDTGLSDSSAEDALMKSFNLPKAGRAPVAREPQDEDDEDEEDEDLDDTEEDDDDEDEEDLDEDADDEEAEEAEKAPKTPAVAPASDDSVVKVTVDGVETEVTVASLKRLAGQEGALTKKSQEADLVGGRAAMMIEGAIRSVVEDLEPYQGADWTLLAQEMEPDEFRWHRETFTRNEARFRTLLNDAENLEASTAARRSTQHTANLTAAKAEMVADVPGWSDADHKKVSDYAISQGLSAEDVAQIANAKILKLLRKAMLQDEGASAVAKKVKMAPARVRKGSGSEGIAEGPAKAHTALEKRVKSGMGSEADAIALLVGRWK